MQKQSSSSVKLKFFESVFGQGKLARNGRNFDVRCPLCAPSDKTKLKLSIHVDDDRVHCWTCGYGSRSLAFLIKRHGSHEQFAEYISKYAPKMSQKAIEELEHEKPTIKLPSDFRLLVTASRVDPDIRHMLRYLTERGLTERDLWYYKFGISESYRWKRRVIMPSFDASGVLNYFVARAIDPWRMPKYDNADGHKTEIIFNELNVDWSQRLVLCEGPFDYVKCGQNAVPLLGSDINENSALFNAIVAHGTPIALALDTDMKSTKAIIVAKKLIKYGIDVTVVDLGEFDDPGKMTTRQMMIAVKKAAPYSWKQSFTTKLNAASKLSLTL